MNLDDLLAKTPKPKITKVNLPEYGDAVFVREMTGAQYDEMVSLASKGGLKQTDIVALCLCDESGAFVSPDADQRRALSSLPASVIQRISDAAMDLNTFEGN